MNSQKNSTMIQQGLDTGSALHSQAVGDFIVKGIYWLRTFIFRVPVKKSPSSAIERDLKFS